MQPFKNGRLATAGRFTARKGPYQAEGIAALALQKGTIPMKNDEDQEHKASTSREMRFLRAWGKLEHIENPRLRLCYALRMYEMEVIMEDWDSPDFALEDPDTFPLPF